MTGIHSDSKLIINGGTINITKSYEGLEGTEVEINGGDIKLNASDDGINAAGGNDNSSINGRPGQNNFSSTSNANITINGGTIYVNATGDGMDSNDTIYIYGGNTIVDGPTNSENGALDYDRELKMTGGTLIAVGSVGMVQSISESSTVYCISAVFSTIQNTETTITVKNSNGDKILEYTPSKQFQSVVIASNKIQAEESYTVYTGSEELSTGIINSIVTNVGSNIGNAGEMQNGGMMNGGGPKREHNR